MRLYKEIFKTSRRNLKYYKYFLIVKIFPEIKEKLYNRSLKKLLVTLVLIFDVATSLRTFPVTYISNTFLRLSIYFIIFFLYPHTLIENFLLLPNLYHVY
jgi:hypothetical protein